MASPKVRATEVAAIAFAILLVATPSQGDVVTSDSTAVNTSEVLFEGVVSSPSEIARSRANVTVYARQVETRDSHLELGETVPLIPMGTVRVDSTGRFTVAADDLRVPAQPADDNGILDVTVVASHGRAFGVHNLSLTTESGRLGVVPGWNASPLHAAAPSANSGPEAALGPFSVSKTTTVNDVMNLELVEPATADVATSAELSEEEPPTTEACGTTYVENLGNRLTYVGSTHSTTSSGFASDFVYTTGGTATLGVGTTYGGGGWQMGGTSSKSSESATGWPAQTSSGDYVRGTYFAYGRYRTELCSQGYVWYEARPRYHYGGVVSYSATTPAASYCAPYPAGSTFSKTSTNAVTWNAGVKLASEIGIDLTARGGYSSSIKNSFSFKSSKRLCGEWAGPGGTSGRLTVKSS